MASFYSLYNDIEYKIKQAQLRLIDISRENKQLQEEKAAYQKRKRATASPRERTGRENQINDHNTNHNTQRRQN